MLFFSEQGEGRGKGGYIITILHKGVIEIYYMGGTPKFVLHNMGKLKKRTFYGQADRGGPVSKYENFDPFFFIEI